MAAGPPVHGTTLNGGCWRPDPWPGFNRAKVCPVLIVTVGSRSGGGGFFFDSTAQARQRWADAMVADLGERKLEPRGTKHDEV
jgi:hypothetical protein